MTTPAEQPTNDPVEARLLALRDATRDVSPRPALAARVLDALRAEETSARFKWDQAWRWSRGGSVLALCATLAAVAVAALDDGRLAERVASASDVGVASGTGDP